MKKLIFLLCLLANSTFASQVDCYYPNKHIQYTHVKNLDFCYTAGYNASCTAIQFVDSEGHNVVVGNVYCAGQE